MPTNQQVYSLADPVPGCQSGGIGFVVSNKPDNKPFDFNLDQATAEVDLSPFRFQWHGKRWSMAHVQELDAWGLIAATGSRDLDVITKMFEVALGEEQHREFASIKLPQYKLQALFDAYMDFCGVDPGESLASTDS